MPGNKGRRSEAGGEMSTTAWKPNASPRALSAASQPALPGMNSSPAFWAAAATPRMPAVKRPGASAGGEITGAAPRPCQLLKLPTGKSEKAQTKINAEKALCLQPPTCALPSSETTRPGDRYFCSFPQSPFSETVGIVSPTPQLRGGSVGDPGAIPSTDSTWNPRLGTPFPPQTFFPPFPGEPEDARNPGRT